GLVEQIAHRVDEDHPRSTPTQRLFKALRPDTQVETLLVGMTRYATPELCKRLCVAVRAARRNLMAPRDGVPGRLCPLDPAAIRQCHFVFNLRSTSPLAANVCSCCVRTDRITNVRRPAIMAYTSSRQDGRASLRLDRKAIARVIDRAESSH